MRFLMRLEYNTAPLSISMQIAASPSVVGPWGHPGKLLDSISTALARSCNKLEPIRNRRKEWEKDIPAVYEILKAGSEKARAVAAKTLDEVKAAMKINYFDDMEMIRDGYDPDRCTYSWFSSLTHLLSQINKYNFPKIYSSLPFHPFQEVSNKQHYPEVKSPAQSRYPHRQN